MVANKKKVVTAVTATAVAAALLLGGTFAWQSINQTALNEASDVINPGGRLHDDFNGSNKDVYVENFADEDIFARIRLDEYFEIIMNKGVTGAERIDSIAGAKDEDGNIISWETHKFDGNDVTKDYWEWATGGSTIYMPTFNLNKDSLVADINGTYQGVDGIVTDEATDDRYTDYTEYTDGQTENGTEIYDADTNMNDEVGKNFDDLTTYVGAGNIATVDGVTHTAESTLGATLISMDEWMTTYGSEPGEYWVYDTDGWVYWAQPIKPGTATGKLLDSIKLSQVMDDSWYYAINVVAQFITADDLGKTDGTGFYDTDNGTVPSDNALALLERIGVEVTEDETETAPDGEENNNVVLLNGYDSDSVLAGWSYELSVASRSAYTYAITEGSEYASLSGSTLTVNEDANGSVTVAVSDGEGNEVTTRTFAVNPIVDTVAVTTQDGTSMTVYQIAGSPTVLANDYLGQTLTVTLPDGKVANFMVTNYLKPSTSLSTAFNDAVNSVDVAIAADETGISRKNINGMMYYHFALAVYENSYDFEPNFYFDIVTTALTTSGLYFGETADGSWDDIEVAQDEEGNYLVTPNTVYYIKNYEGFGLNWEISGSDLVTLASTGEAVDRNTMTVGDVAVGDTWTVTTQFANLVDTLSFKAVAASE